MAALCSMAGTIRLQIEAATITPAAKPVSARWMDNFRFLRRKNTQPAPAAVPINGIKSPMITIFMFGETSLSVPLIAAPSDR